MCHRISTPLSAAALAFVLAACGGGGPSAPAPVPPAPFPASVRLYYDNSGGIADSMRVVVRDAAEFSRLWQQATSRQASPLPPPAIDFNRDMVIVSGAGRLTSDDQIKVDSLGLTRELNPQGQSEETLNVFVSVVLACQRFQIDGFPLEIVRVRRFDGPVRFHDQRRRAEGCPSPSADR